MKKYLDYMYGFSQEDLKSFLGEDIVDLLIEWLPNGDTFLTRQRLIKMIDAVYGTSILKNNEFRECILQNMDKKEIIEMRDNFLKNDEKKENDLIKTIKNISKKPWKKNELSLYLADKWEVSETIFDKEQDDSQVLNVLDSSENRFYELLDYQYYIKQRVLNVLNSGHKQERLLIHMPTGTGKTKTSMHIITNYIEFELKKRGIVIWVAHTTELLQQAYETFSDVWTHLGDGEIKTYKLWGNHNIDNVTEELNGIVFCGLSKLMSIYDSNPDLFERLKKDCRLIVFDEAHKAAATVTQKIISGLLSMPEGYANRALIGLTATPGRTTEESYDNNLLTNMFGGKLIHIDSDILNQINMGKLQALNTIAEQNIIKYFQERRILAKMIPEKLEYQQNFTEEELAKLSSNLAEIGFSEKEYTKDQLKILAKNKERNTAIMQKLRMLSNDNIPTIVFACSVNHAKMLSSMLTIEDIPNSLVLGNMDPIDRKKAIDDFKNRDSDVDIIINYEVLTTGFDSKNIRCVFITRPTKSVVLYSQMLGRGLRGPMMGGNEECLLIDVDDNLEAFDNETAFSHFDDYWRV